MQPANPFRDALKRILAPLVRVVIARGVLYPEMAERLKEVYVDVSARHFRLDGKRLTDSRISLLTGLQRKDIRAVRARIGNTTKGDVGGQTGAGPLPRVLARWVAGPPYADGKGAPIALPRSGGTGPSFETLATEVSRDLHPRTVLDELVRLGLAGYDVTNDLVTLLSAAYLPSRDDEGLAGYFGANLGDHAEAAADNLQAAPAPGPFFERAVHYNQLTCDALDELEELARRLQGEALSKLNTRALALQQRDAGDGRATGRFRCGAFVYRAQEDNLEEPE